MSWAQYNPGKTLTEGIKWCYDLRHDGKQSRIQYVIGVNTSDPGAPGESSQLTRSLSLRFLEL